MSPATRAIVNTSSREEDSAMRWDVTAADARPDRSSSRGHPADPCAAAPVGCREFSQIRSDQLFADHRGKVLLT
jgi:hypothetical protein